MPTTHLVGIFLFTPNSMKMKEEKRMNLDEIATRLLALERHHHSIASDEWLQELPDVQDGQDITAERNEQWKQLHQEEDRLNATLVSQGWFAFYASEVDRYALIPIVNDNGRGKRK